MNNELEKAISQALLKYVSACDAVMGKISAGEEVSEGMISLLMTANDSARIIAGHVGKRDAGGKLIWG